MLRLFAHRVFGVYAISVFAVAACASLLLLCVTPSVQRRRSIVRRAASTVFRLNGMPVRVQGLGHIPAAGCIIVANHASYLDGPILTAALPPRFGFVIKREMTQVPLAHFLLRRIGSEFVERFDTHGSARDARRILQKVTDRVSLAFFPEGTFRSEPGLGRFHSGAFAAAVRGGLPVVPVVIRGSRELLPADRILPRRGRIEVIVKAPIEASGDDPVRGLLLSARRAILEDLDEPDLL